MKRNININTNENVTKTRQFTVQNQVTENFTILVVDGDLNIFAVYKKWEIDQCDNPYLQAWVRMGKIDYLSKTITLETLADVEWMRILMHTEIHGFLPEGHYNLEFDSLLHLFAMVEFMGCETFISRLDFIETTSLFNARKPVFDVYCDTTGIRYALYQIAVPDVICRKLGFRNREVSIYANLGSFFLELMIFNEFHRPEGLSKYESMKWYFKQVSIPQETWSICTKSSKIAKLWA
jgi:hypothetical protein